MKLLPYILMTLFFSSIAAQETSDAEALALLSQVSSDYQAHEQHRIDFFLDIELPGEAKESQKGSLLHEDENFVLTLDGRTVISDGTSLWLYMEDMNEVQINDADMSDEEDMLMKPSDLFDLHTSDKFIFALSAHLTENGEQVTQIEGKPTDADSDYSKVRITLADKNNQVKRFKVFSKDGSRFTMRLSSVDSDVTFDESTFRFDAKDYPGVHVEDLRF